MLVACLLRTHWRYGKRRRRLIVGGDQEEDLPGPWRVHTSYGMVFDGPRTHDEGDDDYYSVVIYRSACASTLTRA